jgi:hypothetical protein
MYYRKGNKERQNNINREKKKNDRKKVRKSKMYCPAAVECSAHIYLCYKSQQCSVKMEQAKCLFHGVKKKKNHNCIGDALGSKNNAGLC